MSPDLTTGVVSHVIQLAIAPVFLLTGVAGLLGVMTTRLARVIDRGRSFETTWSKLDEKARAFHRIEISHLERRRQLCSWSINLCTTTALLICVVIVTLFLEAFIEVNLKWVAAGEFTAAMLALIGGLACFLREVYIATHTTGIDLRRYE